ncbi:hypothetical protein AAIG39_21745 [Phytobacter palmae]|uniref:Morphogenetic protein n=1 Tax=Phytobacter palmae TaxID=1855371 RepID=A0ABU9VAK1_9ENTR
MTERGMIFNEYQVRALIDGRMTQTRRIMSPQPEKIGPEDECGTPGYWIPFHAGRTMVRNEDMTIACPFGCTGDRIWVREACQAVELESGLDVVRYSAGGKDIPVNAHPLDSGLWIDLYRYRNGEGNIVPSIHMPHWASRITLEITGVRVQRLKDADEGHLLDDLGDMLEYEHTPAGRAFNHAEHYAIAGVPVGTSPEMHGFKAWWDKTNGAGSFDANPWVWVIDFKCVEGGAA